MNITQSVWSILKSDLSLSRDLSRDLINVRALARYILDNYEIEASIDSVISAIRRFESENPEKEEKSILNLFKDSKIETRNNVVCLTLSKDAISVLNKVLKKGVRALIASDQIKIICESDQLDLSDYVEKEEKDLGELSITLNQKAVKQKGVLARISNEIALHNINIVESIICPPEFLIYVKEKDMLKTHELLLGLTK